MRACTCTCYVFKSQSQLRFFLLTRIWPHIQAWVWVLDLFSYSARSIYTHCDSYRSCRSHTRTVRVRLISMLSMATFTFISTELPLQRSHSVRRTQQGPGASGIDGSEPPSRGGGLRAEFFNYLFFVNYIKIKSRKLAKSTHWHSIPWMRMQNSHVCEFAKFMILRNTINMKN